MQRRCKVLGDVVALIYYPSIIMVGQTAALHSLIPTNHHTTCCDNVDCRQGPGRCQTQRRPLKLSIFHFFFFFFNSCSFLLRIIIITTHTPTSTLKQRGKTFVVISDLAWLRKLGRLKEQLTFNHLVKGFLFPQSNELSGTEPTKCHCLSHKI